MREAKLFSDSGVLLAAALLDELDQATLHRVSEAVERGSVLRVSLEIHNDGGSRVLLELVTDGCAAVIASLAAKNLHPSTSKSIQLN